MNDTNDGIISKAVSKKVFDTDPNKADILYKVSLAWGDLFR